MTSEKSISLAINFITENKGLSEEQLLTLFIEKYGSLIKGLRLRRVLIALFEIIREV